MMIQAFPSDAAVTQPFIRPLALEDIAVVKAVIDATGLFPSEMLDGMAASYFSGEAGDDVWLVCDNPGPIAIAYYAPERMTSGTWNLYLIAVRPDCQGRGVGAALMRHVEQALLERGERVLLVETSGLPEFARTRAFYAGIGYDQEARIRDFYAEGEDKVVFRRALGAVRAADGL